VNRTLHRFAADDLTEAVRFYKREAGAGVARRFLVEFERVLQLLADFPAIGTPTADGRRSFPFVDFPYAVVYRADVQELRILVVRHQRRDPAHGETRR
jgi:plasmid stabilization system protein ParE